MEDQHKNPKAYMRDQIIKWREERQARLAVRVLHNRNAKVSSAVFGAFSSYGATEKYFQPSATPAVKTKSDRNPKARPKYVPEIKHTKASKLRMIKANPLLEERGLITVPSKKKNTENNTKNSLVQRNTCKGSNTISLFSAHRASVQQTAPNRPSSSAMKHVTLSSAVKKPAPSCVNSVTSHRQSNILNTATIKRKTMARRSLSADAAVRIPLSEVSEDMRMRRAQSSVNVKDIKGTIAEEARNVFLPPSNTPKNYQTPCKTKSELFSKSTEKRKLASSSISLFSPTPDVIRKRLSDWLNKRGKSLGQFHHLHCFGLHATNAAHDTVNKKNCKTENTNSLIQKHESVHHISNNRPYASVLITPQKPFIKEEPSCSNSEDDNKENECNRNSDLLIKGAVADLLNIIHIGYPWDRCGEWLTMIRKSCPSVKELPVYWECLAALEESRGDFKSAVDCYERAIIHGASPTQVGKSLDQLMEKFNMLNLNCDMGNDTSSHVKTPRKQVLDARNIFKSSIIKFALQEKALRRLNTNLGVEASSLHYVVTPVRRSTRLSQSLFRTTPTLLCVKSLNQLEPNVRKSMVFQPNCALDA